MKRILHDTRLVIAIITTVLFILSQVLLVGGGWVGPACIQSITGPSEGDHAMYAWDSYGIPLEFLRVSLEGCFENRETVLTFEIVTLIIDIAVFVLFGMVLYYGVLLLKRLRQRSSLG
jgi:hypothetical protein